MKNQTSQSSEGRGVPLIEIPEMIEGVLADLSVLLDAGYTVVNIEGGPIFEGWRTNMFENLKDVKGLQIGIPKRGLSGLSLAPLPSRNKDRLAFRYDQTLHTDPKIKPVISYHFDDVHCLSLHSEREDSHQKFRFGYTLFDTLNSITKYNREEEFSSSVLVSYDPQARRFIPSEIRTKLKLDGATS